MTQLDEDRVHIQKCRGKCRTHPDASLFVYMIEQIRVIPKETRALCVIALNRGDRVDQNGKLSGPCYLGGHRLLHDATTKSLTELKVGLEWFFRAYGYDEKGVAEHVRRYDLEKMQWTSEDEALAGERHVYQCMGKCLHDLERVQLSLFQVSIQHGWDEALIMKLVEDMQKRWSFKQLGYHLPGPCYQGVLKHFGALQGISSDDSGTVESARAFLSVVLSAEKNSSG